MESLLDDARLAIRSLGRSPTFALTSVLVLALGIGTATAMFSVLRAVLVERLPVSNPDRLVVLRPVSRGRTRVDPAGTVITDMQRRARTIAAIAGVYHLGSMPLPFEDGARQVVLNRSAVTANFFEVLGARPVVGRLLRAEDGAAGASRVAVISHGAWQRRFAGDQNIVGRKLIEPGTGVELTIVGVAPAGLDYPSHADDWEAESPAATRAQQLVVARLAPRVTRAAAAGEYLSFIKQSETQGLGANTFVGAEAVPFNSEIEGGARPVLWALSAAVALLLIIACINAGNLMLLRATGRARELSIRRALGATYGRLARQLAVESALVAVIAGVLGLALAAALMKILIAAAPRELPRLDLVRLDGHMLGMALAVTSVAVVLFGLLPTTIAARADLAIALRADSRTGTPSQSPQAMRRALVVAQVALAVVLVVGAGLLARSLQRLQRISLGYSTDHLSFLSLSYPAAHYDTPNKELAFGDALADRLGGVPGVVSITPVTQPPFHGADFYINKLAVDGQTDTEAETSPFVPWEVGSEEYFQTFGIPILEGRAFRGTDDANGEQVVVISDALARSLFPRGSAIGHHLRPTAGFGTGSMRWTIVGVAGDTHYREFRRATPMVYHPFRQMAWEGLLAIRTSRDLSAVLPALRREVAAVDPETSIWDTETMDDALAGPLSQPKLSAALSTGFAVAALLLAAIGLYGVMAGAVRERTRELGVRLALGATPEELRRGVLRQSMTLTIIGIGIGVLIALGTTRLLRVLLYDVSPTDPFVIGGVCAMLGIVGTLAAYVPARRATQVDPVIALRAE